LVRDGWRFGMLRLSLAASFVVVFQIAGSDPPKAQPTTITASEWSDSRKGCASRIATADAKKQLAQSLCGSGFFRFVRSRNPKIKRITKDDAGRNWFSVEINGVAASFNTVEPIGKNQLPLQTLPSVVWVERISNYPALQCLWAMSLGDASRTLSLQPSTDSTITLPPDHPLQRTRLAAWDASYDGVVLTLYSADDLDRVAAVYVACSQ
jgi:hypothetical protein